MKSRAVLRLGQEKVKNITWHHQPVHTNHPEPAVPSVDATGPKRSPSPDHWGYVEVGAWAQQGLVAWP